jgi:hypothetical protein
LDELMLELLEEDIELDVAKLEDEDSRLEELVDGTWLVKEAELKLLMTMTED